MDVDFRDFIKGKIDMDTLFKRREYTQIENNPDYYVIAKLETPELSIHDVEFSEGD